MTSVTLLTVVQPMLPTLWRSQILIGYLNRSGTAIVRFVSSKKGSVRFTSKNRKNLTQRFPNLQSIPKWIKAQTASNFRSSYPKAYFVCYKRLAPGT